jgi:hypothetical protein
MTECKNGCACSDRYPTKTSTLRYHSNLSDETLEKMKVVRATAIAFSSVVEGMGSSAETTLAFRHIEQALMYAIKHLCLIDPQAVLDPVRNYTMRDITFPTSIYKEDDDYKEDAEK